MQTDVAETIFESVKALSLEKQKEILRQVEALTESNTPTIWKKIRARAKNIPDDVWGQMPEDGSEQHDHYLYGVPKK